MEGNRCIIASKIYVYFTRIYQGAGKLTQQLKYQKLKYTCEHIRFEKTPTQVKHCKDEKKSVEVGIIMTIFKKNHTRSATEI
jgi:hypothetical protein